MTKNRDTGKPISIIYAGDIIEASKWLPYAVNQLMIHYRNRSYKGWSKPVQDIEVLVMPGINRIYINAKGGDYVTYCYNNNDFTSFYMRGTLYSPSAKPTFAVDPIVDVETIKNSQTDYNLANSPYTWTRKKTTSLGTVLFNGPRGLTNILRARFNNYGDNPLSGDIVADMINMGSHTIAASVSHFADQCTCYVEKETISGVSTIVTVFYEASPQTFTITVYDADANEQEFDLSSEIPELGYVDDPRFLNALISPDAKYASLCMLVPNMDTSRGTNSTSTVVFDIVIKLPSGGSYASVLDVSTEVKNNPEYVEDGSNKTDYQDALSSSSDIIVSTFEFCSAIEKTDTYDLLTTIFDYSQSLTAYIGGYIKVAWWDPDITETIVNEGVLNPGNYEEDFAGLIAVNYYDLTFTYYNDIHEEKHLLSAHFYYDSLVFWPYEGFGKTYNLSGVGEGVRHLTTSSRQTKRVETFGCYNKGSPILGFIYDNSKNDNGDYNRHWIDANLKFIDGNGDAVTGPVTVTTTYKQVTAFVVDGPVGGTTSESQSDNLVVGKVFRLYSGSDLTVIQGLNVGAEKLTTVSASATGCYYLSINGIPIAQHLIGPVFDTTERSIDKLVVNYIYAGELTAFATQYVIGAPVCKYLINRVTDTKKPYNLLSRNFSYGDTIISPANGVEISSLRFGENGWNAEINANFIGNSGLGNTGINAVGITDIPLFPNGLQITHQNKDIDKQTAIYHVSYPAGEIFTLAEIEPLTTHSANPASVNGIQLATYRLVGDTANPYLPDQSQPWYTKSRSLKSVEFNFVNKVIYGNTDVVGLYHRLGNDGYVFYYRVPGGAGTLGNLRYAVFVNGVLLDSLVNTPEDVFTAGNYIFYMGFST